MRYIVLSIIIIAAAGFSCKKKDPTSGPTSVQGQVVDQNSGKGIAGATVGLVKQPKDAIGAAGMKQIDGATSHKNGNFSFNFNYDGNYDYKVLATANYYYDSNSGSADVNAGSNKNVKVYLVPKGYVRFLLHNASSSPGVTINITNYNHSINTKKDTSVITIGTGNKSELFYWGIDGSTGSKKDSANIYVKALDTVDYTINY